ncbi:MAG: LLM class flavin-dependent oxidoreductase [Nitrososphaerota archaeon]
MRFSLRLNSDVCGARRAVNLAVLAEKVGFDFFWYCEDLFKRDAWVILTAVAEATERIGLGTAIVNPYTSHVTEIAMRAATLQELSGGRFILGIGAGAPETLSWAGVHVSKPVEGLERAVGQLRRLLSPSHHITEGEAYLRFGQGLGRTPIYIGGQGRMTARLMGRIGDGGLPLLVPPETASKFLPWIWASAMEAGRAPYSVDVSGCFWYCLGESYESISANLGLRELIAYYGPMLSEELLETAGIRRYELASNDLGQTLKPALMRLAITATFNDLEKVMVRLRQLERIGLRHFNLGPPLGEDPAKTIEYTGTVIRRLKEL